MDHCLFVRILVRGRQNRQGTQITRLGRPYSWNSALSIECALQRGGGIHGSLVAANENKNKIGIVWNVDVLYVYFTRRVLLKKQLDNTNNLLINMIFFTATLLSPGQTLDHLWTVCHCSWGSKVRRHIRLFHPWVVVIAFCIYACHGDDVILDLAVKNRR